MKNSIIYSHTILFLITLTACSSSGPESVATKFFENLNAGNFEEAKKYATTDTKSMLSMMESFGAKDQLEDLNKNTIFKVIDTKETDNAAVCTLKITDKETGDEEDLSIHLVKKDSEWLVDMNKEQMNKEGMEDMDKESESPAFDFDDYEN